MQGTIRVQENTPHELGVDPRTLSLLTGVSCSVVYKAINFANEKYLQELYKQQHDANIACDFVPEDEEWLTLSGR